ncbi:MAG: hypothetical protein IT371_20725 [Deltaproteobacteria bacterium]|nr:hypothetical protein [Deltaproteobacteria bacterium]
MGRGEGSADPVSQADSPSTPSARRRVTSRGCVVVDLGLDGVAAALEQRNILVIRAKAPLALADGEWRSVLLSGRLVVTASPGDLEHDASSFDIGIISLRRLEEIDRDPSVKNRTAALISRAIIDLGLWSVRHGFLLELDPSGATERHLFTPLVD